MISIEKVTKTYVMGEVEVSALRGVDLTIDDGEMVAIMGASGSGKSTLMNIIGCLDVPSSGLYVLDGQEVGQLSDDRLAEIRSQKIGFVFQTYNLLPRATALANVELPLLYGDGTDKRKRALDALDRVGLSERVAHKPGELSGGQQQRVAIARALVSRPAILLADEPTGNLDSKSSSEIISLLQTLNKDEGLTVVVVTHEADIAAHTQRIVFMLDGLIVTDEAVDKPLLRVRGNLVRSKEAS